MAPQCTKTEAKVNNLCEPPAPWQAQCWKWKQGEIIVLVLTKYRH